MLGEKIVRTLDASWASDCLLNPFLVSIIFRTKGNYYMHGITMILAVIIELIGIFSVAILFADSSSMELLMNPSSTMAVFGTHSLFGIATLISAVWLVTLWRPESTNYPVKSRWIWKSTIILWVLAFGVGLLLYLALTTNLLQNSI
jgi:hypothetical protein